MSTIPIAPPQDEHAFLLRARTLSRLNPDDCAFGQAVRAVLMQMDAEHAAARAAARLSAARKQGTAVVVDGRSYPSKTRAAVALGCTLGTLNARIARGLYKLG